MTDRESIQAFIESRFGNVLAEGLRADTPLFSSGIVDSFGVLELIAFLEDTFHVTIDPSKHDLTEFDSINLIVQVVERARVDGRA